MKPVVNRTETASADAAHVAYEPPADPKITIVIRKCGAEPPDQHLHVEMLIPHDHTSYESWQAFDARVRAEYIAAGYTVVG